MSMAKLESSKEWMYIILDVAPTLGQPSVTNRTRADHIPRGRNAFQQVCLKGFLPGVWYQKLFVWFPLAR